MHGPTWLRWLKEQFLPKLSGCVRVIDRAPYNQMLTKDARTDTTEMKRAELTVSLGRDEAVPASWASQDWRRVKKKADTTWQAEKHRPAPRCEGRDLARRFIAYMRILPIAHPELNPIELVWGTVKMDLQAQRRHLLDGGAGSCGGHRVC